MAVTVADIFTQATATMTGLMAMSTGFFNGLWEISMGKILITLGIVGAAIALCTKLFLKKKRI